MLPTTLTITPAFDQCFRSLVGEVMDYGRPNWLVLAQHKDCDEMLEKLSAPEAEHGAVTQAMADLAVSEGILPR